MARAKSVKVAITGDSRDLQRAAKDGERSLSRLSSAGGKAMKGLALGAAGAGAAVGGLAAVGLFKATKAAIEAEKANARLTAQLTALGKNTPAVRKNIDDTVSSLSKMSGFDDEDLSDAFARIVRSTDDVKTALGPQGLQLAMDIARAKQIDVAKAAEIVAKAQDGQTMGLKRLGVEITKNMTPTQALAAATKALGGQAEAYANTTAGSMEKASTAWENLGETVGAKVSPLVAAAATKGVELIEQAGPKIERALEVIGPIASEAWGKVQKAAGDAMDFYRANVQPTVQAVSTFIRDHGEDIKRVFRAIGAFIGIFLNNLKSIVKAGLAVIRGDWDGAWNALKEIPRNMIRGVKAILENIGPVLGNAGKAAGKFIVDQIEAGVKAAPGAIKNALGTLIDEVPKLSGVAVGKLGELATAVIRAVPGVFGKVGSEIIAALRGALERVDFPTPYFTMGEIGGIDPPGPGSIPAIPYPTGIAFRAGGGWVGDGTRHPGDRVLALLTPGERVITERQAAILGTSTVDRVLALTGGRAGGRYFAAGGRVFPDRYVPPRVKPDPDPNAHPHAAPQGTPRPLPATPKPVGTGTLQGTGLWRLQHHTLDEAVAFARAQLGHGYSQKVRLGPTWDCSGYAGAVAAKIAGYTGGVGGWTGSYWPMVSGKRRADSNDPVVWGFRGNPNSTNGAHMGIRLLGRWYDAGSGGVEANQTDGAWKDLRVPPGLDYLRAIALEGKGGPPAPPTEGAGAVGTGGKGGGGGHKITDPPRSAGGGYGVAAGAEGTSMTASGDGYSAPAASVAAAYDPLPDVQAQLARTEGDLQTALRGLRLSEAAVRVFGGSRDLTGGPSVTFQSVFPPTPQMMADAAAAVAGGFRQQGAIVNPRATL